MLFKDFNKDGVFFIGKLLLAGLIFLAFNYFELGGAVKSILEVYAEPVSYWSGSAAAGVNDFFYSITEVGTVRQKYNDLVIDCAKKEAELAQMPLLTEENAALAKQLKLGSTQNEYIEATVMNSGLLNKGDYLIINKGAVDGVKVGQVAQLGNIYVGRVIEVSQTSSKIITPFSTKSSLQVGIIKTALENIKQDEMKKALADSKFYVGVAVGSIAGIRIENVAAKSDIKEGYYVYVDDEKVSEYLILGRVSTVEGGSADASKTVNANPILNYDNLKFVFLKK